MLRTAVILCEAVTALRSSEPESKDLDGPKQALGNHNAGFLELKAAS